MALDDYLKCPGLDETLNSFPETFPCPECGNEIEKWTDEKKGKCLICNKMIAPKRTC